MKKKDKKDVAILNFKTAENDFCRTVWLFSSPRRDPQGRGERSTTDVPPAPSITESNILGDVTNITRRVGEPEIEAG